jgi:hypothetical protein
MKFEQTKAYGGADKFSLWYLGNHKLEYGEVFQITFSCQFDFSHFPFDSHECLMEYGSYEVAENKLTFKPPTVSYKNKMTKSGYDPIIHNSLEHQYQLYLETLPTSTHMDEIDNTKHSSTGICLKFYRNSFGHLISSFYYPTGCFALLSMISYLIKPDVVSHYYCPGFVLRNFYQIQCQFQKRFSV